MSGTREYKTMILTNRELELLQSIASDGYDPNRLMREMNISHSTLRCHLSAIYEKLDVHNITNAIMVAIGRDLVSLSYRLVRVTHD